MRVDVFPWWARLYAGYQAAVPAHKGKRRLLHTLTRVGAWRGRPFTIPLANGIQIVVSPEEGLLADETVGWTCLREGAWEPHVEKTIRELLQPGDLALDVGANIGYFSAVMAEAVGATGRVLSLEPAPANAALLRTTLRINRLSWVSVLEIAAGNVEDELVLSFDPRLPGNASLHYRGTGEAEDLKVDVRPLDDLQIDRKPALIKIDAEGSELAVCQGARRLITEFQPALIFEWNATAAAHAGWTLQELLDCIAACAPYEFVWLTDEEWRPLTQLHDFKDGDYADVLGLPTAR
jgi:FkbM family methyltransferase